MFVLGEKGCGNVGSGVGGCLLLPSTEYLPNGKNLGETLGEE